jgi:hypothetical protein
MALRWKWKENKEINYLTDVLKSIKIVANLRRVV